MNFNTRVTEQVRIQLVYDIKFSRAVVNRTLELVQRNKRMLHFLVMAQIPQAAVTIRALVARELPNQ